MASELVPPAPKIESGSEKVCSSRASIDAVDAEAFSPTQGAQRRWAAASLRCGGLQAANPGSGMNSHRSHLGDFTEGAILHGTSKSSFPRQPKRQPRAAATHAKQPKRPAAGTLAQTRNLVLAAVRVWELKQGIR